jgi:hypothetical protein
MNPRALDFFEAQSPDFFVASLQGVFHLDGMKTAWTNVSSGITSVDCVSLAIDRADPRLVYAGSGTVGVFVTTNGGVSWAPANQGITNLIATVVEVDPEIPKTVYAGTAHAGAFKSTDGGATWKEINSGLQLHPQVIAFAVDPRNGSNLFLSTAQVAGSTEGIFRSTNGGSSWMQVDTAVAFALLVDPTDSQVVYAGGNFGGAIFRKSIDGGGSFSPTGTGLPAAAVQTLVSDPTNAQILYAGTMTTGGVYRSGDGGGSWTAATTGIQETEVQSLAIDPVTPTTLYAASSVSVYRSTNAGGTWKPAATGLMGDNWRIRIAHSDGQVLYAVGSAGIYRSGDAAGTWTRLPSEPFVFGADTVAVDPSDANIAYFGFNGGPGVIKTTTGGQ